MYSSSNSRENLATVFFFPFFFQRQDMYEHNSGSESYEVGLTEIKKAWLAQRGSEKAVEDWQKQHRKLESMRMRSNASNETWQKALAEGGEIHLPLCCDFRLLHPRRVVLWDLNKLAYYPYIDANFYNLH
jgi:hypothetical protein